jgi:hypothetical protein
MEAIPGIDNLGRIGPEEFSDEIAKTKILIGIGQVSRLSLLSSLLLPSSLAYAAEGLNEYG